MKKTIREWFNQTDKFFSDPMRALIEGYTIDELRDEYARVYVGKYAEEFFNQDLQTMAVCAFYAKGG